MIMSVFVLFALMRPVTTALHELGHALPALLFTAGAVSIFIGVPDSSTGPPLFTMRRLRVWFTKDPLRWLGGYCSHEPPAHRWQSVVILLGGVLFSMGVAVAAAILSFRIDAHGFILTLMLLLAVSTVIDVFTNLVPSSAPVTMPDGRITFNDGEQLRRLLFPNDLMKEAHRAVEHSQAGRHEDAWTLYERFLRSGWKDPAIYYNAIGALLHLDRHEEALDLHKQWCAAQEVDAKGLALGGLVLCRSGGRLEALELYDQALALDPHDPWTLNNKGYTLNLLGRYSEAIEHFDRALAGEENKAYPLNNRGLARLRLGDTQGGLADINEGLRIDPANAYGYRNLGIHHLDEGRVKTALELFQKAKSLDADTDDIDELIAQARKGLS